MKIKFLFSILTLLFLITILVAPVYVQAQQARTEGKAGVQDQTPGTSCQGGLCNPLNVDDPRVIIGNIISALLGIVGSLALAVFIFGGFTWVTAAGNDEKIKKGKEILMWATFGLVVIFFSYAMVKFVITALTVTS